MTSVQTPANFDAILIAAIPALRPVCEALRELITAQHPACVEIVWPKLKIASYGVGPKKTTQHYAYIAVQPSHINLGFYHGMMLNDPAGLLEGSGKALRHVKVRHVADTRNAALADLLRQAISDRRRLA
ncbi:MAG TPA: DUF1801 domain-containing protein [Rhodanobacteraceae bacterium]|nr:DUF1801 domain-containing protein [Rhodanobacteraceae bacterium]